MISKNNYPENIEGKIKNTFKEGSWQYLENIERGFKK